MAVRKSRGEPRSHRAEYPIFSRGSTILYRDSVLYWRLLMELAIFFMKSAFG